MKMIYPLEWPQFFTASINDLQPLLANEIYKDIIIAALRFAVTEKRISLSAFVIMINLIHIVWQVLPPYTQTQVQLGFMKYTAQKIKFHLQQFNPNLLEKYKVEKKDREYQIWKRRPLSVELSSDFIYFQKIEYIHYNPVKAGICEHPEDYKYSSAKFGKQVWMILGYSFLKRKNNFTSLKLELRLVTIVNTVHIRIRRLKHQTAARLRGRHS